MQSEPYRQPCECGCGRLAKPHRRFIHGHSGGAPPRTGGQHPQIRPCSKCEKYFWAFWYGHGYDGYCKRCAANYMREYAKRNPPTTKQRKRRRQYTQARYYKYTHGISVEEAHALRDAQGGKCLICTRKAVHLDHDHETGEIRGWLCAQCNFGLGNFAESPKRMLRAIAYLERQLTLDS